MNYAEKVVADMEAYIAKVESGQCCAQCLAGHPADCDVQPQSLEEARTTLHVFRKVVAGNHHPRSGTWPPEEADLDRRLVIKSAHAQNKGIGACQCADCQSIGPPRRE